VGGRRRKFSAEKAYNVSHALAVPGDAGQMPALGPAAVAVHDDRYMLRELARIEFAENLSFLAVQP